MISQRWKGVSKVAKIKQTVEQMVPKSRYLETLNVYGMIDASWELVSSEEIDAPELGPPGAHETQIRILMSRVINAPERRGKGSSMREILALES